MNSLFLGGTEHPISRRKLSLCIKTILITLSILFSRIVFSKVWYLHHDKIDAPKTRLLDFEILKLESFNLQSM